jgi:hypothetical protein
MGTQQSSESKFRVRSVKCQGRQAEASGINAVLQRQMLAPGFVAWFRCLSGSALSGNPVFMSTCMGAACEVELSQARLAREHVQTSPIVCRITAPRNLDSPRVYQLATVASIRIQTNSHGHPV